VQAPLLQVKVYNLIKKVVLRQQDDDGFMNLKNFSNLLKEIRVKINMEQEMCLAEEI